MTLLDDLHPSTHPGRSHRAPPPTRSTAAVLSGVTLALLAAGLVMALASAMARSSTGFAHFTVFWVGFGIAVVAVVAAGVVDVRGRWVRPAVLVLFGVVTFVPKFVMSVDGPAYFDEYSHLRHVDDMLAHGGVFVDNPLLGVVRYFPGLGLVTEGVHYATRLDAWHSGQVVILLAHCAALPVVYALCRTLRLTERAAFFGALVFATNPGYMYFDSQYGYESLAITLMLATLLCAVRAAQAGRTRSAVLAAAAGVVLASATVLTHHVTALFLSAMCLLVAAFVPKQTRGGRWAAWLVATWTVVATGVWLFGVATGVRTYLFTRLGTGGRQLLDIALGSSGSGGAASGGTGGAPVGPRTLFAGNDVPTYEHVLAFAVPPVVAVGLVAALWRAFRAGRGQRGAELRTLAPFALLSLGYLLSLPLTFTDSGGELAHRSWPFLYVGVAVTLAWVWGRTASVRPDAASRHRRPALVVGASLVLVMAVGNVSAGASITYRFPGPYEFGADNRFQTAELRQVVAWAADHLPPDAGVITDRFTLQQVLAATDFRVPDTQQSGAYQVFLAPEDPSPDVRALLRDNGFDYFVLDLRAVDHAPVQPLFQSYDGLAPAQLRALADIRDNRFIHLIHATQHYRVYRLRP